MSRPSTKASTKGLIPTREELEQDFAALADGIRSISSAVNAMRKSGLKDRAIIVLLADHTKLPKVYVKSFLEGLASLSTYLEERSR